jgi:uncharacterized protein YgiM (DUF1202 family)
VVLTDGLNLREKADVTSKSIRGLQAGETLIVISKSGDWLQVRDPTGATGWVTNNSQYVQILK